MKREEGRCKGKVRKEERMGFQIEALPENCIANILSLTTPVDACRLSLVCEIFCSAAQSDTVWGRFLRSETHFISQPDPSYPSPSKKALYLTRHPVIIDDGRKSFQLGRNSWKKCYMLAAEALSIIWGDTPRYWKWTTLPESRFPKVAQLLDVCWFEIRGMINTSVLSSDTQYAAYLVFKMINARGFHNCPVELSLGIFGSHRSTKNVCLDPNLEEQEGGWWPRHGVAELERPNLRSDGWLEIEMGEFFNLGQQDVSVEMSVKETVHLNWKRGFFLQGIEVRPTEDN